MSDSVEESLGRIARKVCFGGIVGLTGGAYAAVVHAKPLGASCWAGFHGCVILMGYFSIFQEGARSARGVADPINSWIAGSGAGYVLSASQHGHRSGMRTGLYGGLAVGGLHYLKDQMPVGLLRRLLVSWDLLDPPRESEAALETGPATDDDVEDNDEHDTSWWEKYVPFRRIIEEEIAAREAMAPGQREHQMDPPQPRTAEIQQLLEAKSAHDPKNDEVPP